VAGREQPGQGDRHGGPRLAGDGQGRAAQGDERQHDERRGLRGGRPGGGVQPEGDARSGHGHGLDAAEQRRPAGRAAPASTSSTARPAA
jgi:hypothetical protein